MKQIYFLFFIALLGFNQTNAQACPESGGSIENGTAIVFYYPNASVACGLMPVSITVTDNVTTNSSTFTIDANACASTISSYTLTSGDPLSGQGFVVTSGFDTNCSYSNGTLPVEVFTAMSKNLKLYPSPVLKGNEVQIAFGMSTSAKIEIFSLTGKMVLSDSVTNKTSKSISISHLVNGLYLVKIEAEHFVITRKIVISK